MILMCEIHILYIQLHDIPAGRTLNVQVAIQIESCDELFDWCLRQDDLSFCEKLIKRNFKKIPVSSFYIPQEPTADVLIIHLLGRNLCSGTRLCYGMLSATMVFQLMSHDQLMPVIQLLRKVITKIN